MTDVGTGRRWPREYATAIAAAPEITQTTDVVVVGAGGAGLYAALTAARAGADVVLISATPLAQTASYWAQGGLAAALAPDDSPEIHLADTEIAGRGLVRRSAAEVLVAEAPGAVADLQTYGVNFDGDREGRLALSLEGGHSRRRVIHAGGSATGRRVVRQLSGVVVEDPRITVIEGARAAGLWVQDGRCIGVICEDGRSVVARATILATGGAAALWSRTTNPPGSVGIGMMLAHAAGAALADLEFVQFHPTAVTSVPGREGFLVTEAIRGEGARLLGPDGERFVEELQPRDVVSRAVETVMREHDVTHVDLDMRGVDPLKFQNIVGALRESGLDPTTQLVPVAPAVHYFMGGIVADLDGATTLPGLYAIGESSCTGLHGANRLASNSLSECFVWGHRAASACLDEPRPVVDGPPPVVEPIQAPSQATRDALWRDAGIVRTPEGLQRLLSDPHPLARMVARCALMRTESRGAHHRTDFPDLDPSLDGRHAVLTAEEASAYERWS
jgi:L-aspartate oxidase